MKEDDSNKLLGLSSYNSTTYNYRPTSNCTTVCFNTMILLCYYYYYIVMACMIYSMYQHAYMQLLHYANLNIIYIIQVPCIITHVSNSNSAPLKTSILFLDVAQPQPGEINLSTHTFVTKTIDVLQTQDSFYDQVLTRGRTDKKINTDDKKQPNDKYRSYKGTLTPILNIFWQIFLANILVIYKS